MGLSILNQYSEHQIMPTIHDLTTKLKHPRTKISILFFWSSSHPPSSPNGKLSNFFQTLATLSPANVSFYRVEADVLTDLCIHYSVKEIPTFIILNESGNIFKKVIGGKNEDIAAVTNAVKSLKKIVDKDTEPESTFDDYLKSVISSQKVMLFMKGSPEQPFCGFSRQIVNILTSQSIEFGSFDILTNEQVRQGLKRYSDWPTYPQLYVNGELVGGLDIVEDMVNEGHLKEQLGL